MSVCVNYKSWSVETKHPSWWSRNSLGFLETLSSETNICLNKIAKKPLSPETNICSNTQNEITDKILNISSLLPIECIEFISWFIK